MKKQNVFGKKLTAAVVAASTLLLAACSGSSSPAASETATSGTSASETVASEAASTADSAAEATTGEAVAEGTIPAPEGDDNVIRVGVSPVPHEQIMADAVAKQLEEAGWKLEISTFSDYVLPNTSLEADELDANYFQTLGYMNAQNEEAGLHLAAVAGVHIEPMGIYSASLKSIDEIQDGATVGIPNDTDNGLRALELLVQKGLLVSTGKVGTDGATFESLTEDAEANPKGLVITPIEAAALPLNLEDLDFACVNGNYALGADLPNKYPALDIEEFDDDTTVRRTNFLVVKQGNEDTLKTQALIAATLSPAVEQYITDTYKGAVIASFIDAPSN